MDIKKLQTLVVDALEDVKGQDITVFDTVHLTSLFDRIAVVSGTSNRQTKALAASVRDKVKAAGGDVIGIEGEDTGEWVLVDLGDMIVHIMQPAIRQYYRLEEIWGDKPVKLGAAKRKGTVEAAEAAEVKPKSKHLASTQEAPEVKPVNERKPAAKKAAAAKTPAAAKKAPAKKAASKAVGKVVKVAATKTEEAAVKALKALPPKRAAAVKAPKAPADAVPVKKVIKRVAKKDAE
ncbi:ribosome silencing factor [Massilia aquatica]|uniref:Ribosomal silencing factor RsfS n=1 Tax=Massilia aquatica TaxID=2609000 RepID=A0ABX0M1Q8_9BURK|nr:ribosome silencing factor [Massilia aquatica]NHZ39025.1 ribosome silencing factor [Massilia aquatica]